MLCVFMVRIIFKANNDCLRAEGIDFATIVMDSVFSVRKRVNK